MKRLILSRAGSVLLAIAYIGGVSVMGSQGTLSVKGYSPEKIAFSLDGKFVGLAFSAEGGGPEGLVADNKSSGGLLKKHIAAIKYQDFLVLLPVGMASLVKDWIDAALNAKALRKDGSISFADARSNVQSVRSFTRAYLTEVGFPALDGSLRDPVYLTLRFSPEASVRTKSSGTLRTPVSAASPVLASTFRLELEGLDCSHVAKIDAVTVRVKEQQGAQREVTRFEISDLVLTVPEINADSFFKWRDEFLLQGKHLDVHEKKGSLVYLDGTRASALLTLNFSGIGVVKIDDADRDRPDSPRLVRVHLYCEKIDIVAPQPPR